MKCFPEGFKERIENLINNSFIPLVLDIKSDMKKVNIDSLESQKIEKLLEERIEYLENLIFSGWLDKISKEKRNNTFYNLWSELEEARTLLEEHRRNVGAGAYFN